MENKQTNVNTKGFDPTQYTIGVVSLGCDKNRVDTENMITYLLNAGYRFVSDSSEADIIIINTCAFIEASREESRQNIEEMIEFRKNGRCKCLVVTGCYPQKYLNEITDLYDIDVCLGTNEYKQIEDHLKTFFTTGEPVVKNNSKDALDCIETGRVITTPAHYAFVRVADGCDNFCSYCTIPYIRGRFRSRRIESVVRETEDLVKNGAKEIILVAQDLSKYGADIYGRPKLTELVQNLSKIEKLQWIRLLYCYPENVDDDLIAEIKNNDKLCKYIDIPFQHVSTKILDKMNRKITHEQVEELVTKLKTEVPNISIRTTFMVGFPNETKEDFEELCNFLKKHELENVGFFAYSKENGTVSARFENQIDDWTKQKRLVKLARLQKKIVKKNNRKKIGQIQRVLLEGVDYAKNRYYGRNEGQAPDIDTICYFTSDRRLEVGEFYDVLIKRVKGYDLIGERV